MHEGLFLARLIFGLLMAGHGSQKLFGWFGGYGLNGTGAFFETLGFRPGRFYAAGAAIGEILGGLLLALGFLGPIGPAIILSVMIVAAVTVHWKNGVFVTSNGIEVPLLYATASVALALTGPGRFSVDALLGLTPVWTPAIVVGALVVGVAAAAVNLALRRTPVTA